MRGLVSLKYESDICHFVHDFPLDFFFILGILQLPGKVLLQLRLNHYFSTWCALLICNPVFFCLMDVVSSYSSEYIKVPFL